MVAEKDKFKGYICDCCGLYVKAYRRKLNSNMAVCLAVLHKTRTTGFVHLENFMQGHGYKRSGMQATFATMDF